jgi:hypothetical protein
MEAVTPPADERRKANLASLAKARAAKAELRRQVDEAKEVEDSLKREREKEVEIQVEEEENRVQKKQKIKPIPEEPKSFFRPRPYYFHVDPPKPEPPAKEPIPPSPPDPTPDPPVIVPTDPITVVEVPAHPIYSEMWSAGFKIGTALVLYFISAGAATWGAQLRSHDHGYKNPPPQNYPPDGGLQYWR